ncbi:MAG: hypothetical protein ACXVJE_19350 [Mucilaginibacter sp.]
MKAVFLAIALLISSTMLFAQATTSHNKIDTLLFSNTRGSLFSSTKSLNILENRISVYSDIIVYAPNPKLHEPYWQANYRMFKLLKQDGKTIMEVFMPDTTGKTKIHIDVNRIHFVNDSTILIDNK